MATEWHPTDFGISFEPAEYLSGRNFSIIYLYEGRGRAAQRVF